MINNLEQNSFNTSYVVIKPILTTKLNHKSLSFNTSYVVIKLGVLKKSGWIYFVSIHLMLLLNLGGGNI